ncbi:MAG TPA: S41 family peptidase [Solirubrobacteraceae bacterium]|nr:S41 family peptidase [Solirubrobacteraceae bacterium]
MKNPLRVAGVVLVLLIGVWFGGHPSWLPSPLRSVFVSQTANQKLTSQVMGLLAKDYYRPLNVQKLENLATTSGLEAAVSSLGDPYSHYYPPSLYQSFQNEMTPQVAGIGVAVAPDPVHGGTEIEEVFQGSPAAKAGLRDGDVIVAVNGRSLKRLSVNASGDLIRGKSGTKVRLTILRDRRRFEVTMTRADVQVPVASSKLVRYKGLKLGYLAFSQFAQNSAAELRGQVRQMLHDGAQGLILDLRDNPGGLVTQAIGVASLFIQNGTIVTTRGRNVPTTVYTALGDAIAPKIPMAVLVDRGTASSAEIVTGALKDHHRATVIGTNTYGKGVFQEIQPVSGGGALDITVGEYFTPNGQNLGAGGVKEGKGITPNVYVYDNPQNPGSKALDVAEQTLARQIR